LIFFIPALKVNFYLKNFKKHFLGRKILIAKEVTKIHETFYREDINNINMFKNTIKGELTIVISETGNKNKEFNKKEITKKAKKYLKQYSLKDSVDLIFQKERVNKKKIYELCLKIKNEKNN